MKTSLSTENRRFCSKWIEVSHKVFHVLSASVFIILFAYYAWCDSATSLSLSMWHNYFPGLSVQLTFNLQTLVYATLSKRRWMNVYTSLGRSQRSRDAYICQCYGDFNRNSTWRNSFDLLSTASWLFVRVWWLAAFDSLFPTKLTRLK